jgi:hypothetical protein
MPDELVPIELVYFYASADKPLCNQLDDHLSTLRQEGLITTWHKHQITPGADWTKILDEHLNTASVILLLITARFLASNDFSGREMQRAIERHRAGEICVIPILLRPVVWETALLRNLQPLPSNRIPVSRWANRDEAFVDIAKGIRKALDDVLHSRVVPAMPKQCVTDKNAHRLSNDQLSHKTLTNTVAALRTIESSQPNITVEPRLLGETKTSAKRYIIDTQEAIRLFSEFMQDGAQKRIFCLVGETNMGKSHLLANILPPLAKKSGPVRLASLDLNRKGSSVPDLLSQICTQLGSQHFDAYYTQEEKWMSRPKTSIVGPEASAKYEARTLTRYFVEVLSQLADQTILLLFDSFEKAKDVVQLWLTDIFLLSIANLEHVRVLIAGQSSPKIDASYQEMCQVCELRPLSVEEVDEFVAYCQHCNISLSKKEISMLAFALEYVPGAFVKAAFRFTRGEGPF